MKIFPITLAAGLLLACVLKEESPPSDPSRITVSGKIADLDYVKAVLRHSQGNQVFWHAMYYVVVDSVRLSKLGKSLPYCDISMRAGHGSGALTYETWGDTEFQTTAGEETNAVGIVVPVDSAFTHYKAEIDCSLP